MPEFLGVWNSSVDGKDVCLEVMRGHNDMITSPRNYLLQGHLMVAWCEMYDSFAGVVISRS